MKKLITLACLTFGAITIPIVPPQPAAQTAVAKAGGNQTFSYSFNTFYIHNLGTQPVKLNSISVLFSIGTEAPQPYQLTYKKTIKGGKVAKIPNAKIKFGGYPAGTQINYSGISQINVDDNQIIKISNAGDYDIYITNQGTIWKETTKPKTIPPTKKNVTAQIAPEAKDMTPAAKSSTVKSAAVVLKQKQPATMKPQSKVTKAINATTKPAPAIIKPETPKQ